MSLFIHAKHAAADGHPSCRIMIQFPGTEVFLLGVMHFVSLGCEELWIKTARDVTRTLADRMCKALPAILPALFLELLRRKRGMHS